MMELDNNVPIVFVRWYDNIGDDHQWFTREEIMQIYNTVPEIQTVGWLLHEDDDKIIVAHSKGQLVSKNLLDRESVEACSGIVVMYKPMIIEKIIIKEGNESEDDIT